MSFFPNVFNYFAFRRAGFAALTAALLLAPVAHSQPATGSTPTIGGEAPTPEITFLFQTAFYRNSFNTVAVLPPYTNVSRLGTAGLVQEFETAADKSTSVQNGTSSLVLVALIMPDQNAPASNTSVLQVLSDIYGYYQSLGPSTVGMPTEDTQTCPGNAPEPCTYQIFSNDYALFAYSVPLVNGQDFYLKDPEYTKWQSLGGISGPVGLPINVSTAITASTGTTANEQLFTGGAFFGITSGNYNGSYSAVYGPMYTTYVAYQGAAGPLGLPLANQFTLPDGSFQQTFEGGSIQYTTGSTPVVLFPVSAVSITGPGNVATGVTINLNATVTLTANVYGAGGSSLTGRTVTWSATNTNVVSLTPNGNTVTVKGIGGGTATVTATVTGVASTGFTVTVNAPCCQVGTGAPSAVQTAFINALSRNQIQASLPLPTAAQLDGNGYIQMITPVGSTEQVLVAEALSSSLAYVVSGAILTTYMNAGGPTGIAGYPTSDVTSGGRQMFTNAAIAGSPAFMVSGQILTKWTALGYETGAAGVPSGSMSTFTTALGEGGLQQPFQGGTIYGLTSGQYRGQTYLVSGLILAAYNTLGGPTGAYGAPLSDQTSSGALNTQTFENGTISYNTGDSAAVGHPNPRTPAISAYPATTTPGGRLTLSIAGFANGATVTVTVGNQPSFTVTAPLGVFAWNYVVPSSATVGTVKLTASDTSGNNVSGSFAVQSTASLGPKLTIVQGNTQSAGVSAVLPLPLQVAVDDSNGNPLSGVTVTFVASPGASLSATSVQTDANGMASTTLRLPSATGVAEVTAQALGQYVTFGAMAVSTPALSVPAMTATSQSALGSGTPTIAQQGALVTAAAMVLGYYQGAGKIGAPNGTATPDTLNKYLSNCGSGCNGYLSSSSSGQQVVNLWQLSAFTGGATDLTGENPSISSIQQLLAGGSPVLVFLALTANGLPVGGTTVVATGVNNDGSLAILDPNPVLAQTNMNGYLYGFQAANASWKGTIVSALCIVLSKPVASSFVLGSISQSTSGGGVSLDLESSQGSCGPVLEIPDSAVIGSTTSVPLRSSRFIYCIGTNSPYQAGISSAAGAYEAYVQGNGLNKDLSGTGPAAYALTISSSGTLSVASQKAAFAANAVLNAATFVAGIAPGGLFSIFGSGLYGPSSATSVTFGTEAAQLILSSPFQLNGQVPGDLAPGNYTVTLQSAWGSASQQVSVSQTAPGIFVVNTETGNRVVGAVINQNGTLNDLGAPANRGDVLTVYCTNLGAVQQQGNLYVTTSPVTALLSGGVLPVQYAGLTPGFVGLYQVNVPIPAGMAPGASLTLSINAGGVASNTVNVAIQ